MVWQDHRVLAAGLRDQACADLLVARFLLLSRTFTINERPTSFAHAVLAKSQQACEKLLKGYLLFNDRMYDPTAGHRPMTDTTEMTEHQLQRRERLFVALNRGNTRIVSELKWLENHAPHRPRPVIEDNPAPLAVLPHGLQFPAQYRGRVRHDGAAGALIVSDRINRNERQELMALSPDIAYRTALERACTDANNRAGLPQPLYIIPMNSEYPFWSELAGALVMPAQGLDVRRHGVRAMKAALSLFKTISQSDPRAFTSPLAVFLERYPLSSNLDDLPGLE